MRDDFADGSTAPSKVEPGAAMLWPDVESCRRRGLQPSWYSNPWEIPVILDNRDPVEAAATVKAFTLDFNDFLRNEKRDAFVLQPAAPLRGGRSVWYAAYAVALVLSVLSLLTLRRGRRPRALIPSRAASLPSGRPK